jgi:hypothetical protein
MITIIIAPFILTLLYLTIQNKEQKSLNYILIALLIIGVYFLLKKNDMIENMTDKVNNVYSINSSVIDSPPKWEKQEANSDKFNSLKEKIFEKLGKNYYLIQVYLRNGRCPSHLDVIDTDETSIVWERMKEKVDNNQHIYVREKNNCIFLVINKQINWTELPKDNNLYNNLNQELRGPYGVTVAKIMKGDLSCNKTPQFIEDMKDNNKMKEIIGTHGFFYYNKDNLCHKVDLISNPKKSIYKINMMNQVVEVDKVISVLKNKFDDCKLNIVEDIKDEINQQIIDLKAKKIERSLLANNKNLKIEEDANNKVLILKMDKHQFRQKIINNLNKEFNSQEIIKPEDLKNINCLIGKLGFVSVEIKTNKLFSINEQLRQSIKSMIHLHGVTFLFTQDKIIAIPASKEGIPKSCFIEILNIQNTMNHPEKSNKYYMLTDKKIIGIKDNKIINYDFNIETVRKEDIEKPDLEEQQEESEKQDGKINFVLLSKDKHYLIYKNKISIFSKSENKIIQNKSIKEVLGEDLKIIMIGLYHNKDNNKYIILTQEDIYYLYDPITDVFSEAKMSNIDLNIDLRLFDYQDPKINCKEYGAVLGDLVRSQDIEATYRRQILEGLNSCKN